MQDSPLTLIGIEEPELTIHPGALRVLYDFIDEASRTEQILLTTHSPDLLDCIDIDAIRLVERKNGITSIGLINEEQRKMVKDKLITPGELIRMEDFQTNVE